MLKYLQQQYLKYGKTNIFKIYRNIIKNGDNLDFLINFSNRFF